jgi:hypothetical protein
MKAIQIQSYGGGLEVLRTTTLSDPDPAPDEVVSNLLSRKTAAAVWQLPLAHYSTAFANRSSSASA